MCSDVAFLLPRAHVTRLLLLALVFAGSSSASPRARLLPFLPHLTLRATLAATNATDTASPSFPNISAFLASRTDLQTFQSAAAKTGLLKKPINGTLFLPVDQAWADLAKQANVTLTKLLSSTQLSNVLNYHLLAATRLYSKNITQNMTRTMSNGLNVTFTETLGANATVNITLIDEGGRKAPVLSSDTDAGTVLVYTIAAVLVPSTFIASLAPPPPFSLPPFSLPPFSLPPYGTSSPSPSPAPSPPASSAPPAAGSLMQAVLSSLASLNLTAFEAILNASGTVITGDATLFAPTNQAMLDALTEYAAFIPGGVSSVTSDGGAIPPSMAPFLPLMVNPAIAAGKAYQLSELTDGLVVGSLTVVDKAPPPSVFLTSSPSQSAKLTGQVGSASIGGATVSIFVLDTVIIDLSALGR